MTVQDLIKLLKDLPPEAPVLTYLWDGSLRPAATRIAVVEDAQHNGAAVYEESGVGRTLSVVIIQPAIGS